jgi:hypothetical protein
LTPEQFEQRMEETAKAVDLLAILMGDTPVEKGETAITRQRAMPSLYGSDLDYIIAGLSRGERYDFHVDSDRQMVSLTVPKDLERILKRALPHRTQFDRKEYPNPDYEPDMNQATVLLPEVVSHGRKHISECRERINSKLKPKLDAVASKLEHLRKAKQLQIDFEFGDADLVPLRLRQKHSKQARIDRLFNQHQAYVEDTLTTEDAAFLRVAAVFRGE